MKSKLHITARPEGQLHQIDNNPAASRLHRKATVMNAVSDHAEVFSAINPRRAVTIGAALAALGAAASLLALPVDAQTGFVTSVPPYAVSISNDYVALPILSSGDRVPLASDASKQFQMIGVPDGLGAHKIGDGALSSL
jgi:hypothetical protein